MNSCKCRNFTRGLFWHNHFSKQKGSVQALRGSYLGLTLASWIKRMINSYLAFSFFHFFYGNVLAIRCIYIYTPVYKKVDISEIYINIYTFCFFFCFAQRNKRYILIFEMSSFLWTGEYIYKKWFLKVKQKKELMIYTWYLLQNIQKDWSVKFLRLRLRKYL